MLGFASRHEGGLSNFLENTVQDDSVLAGCCASFGVSLIISVIISLVMNWNQSKAQADFEWIKTMSIDNPLSPWVNTYRRRLPRACNKNDETILSAKDMGKVFRTARLLAYIGGLILISVLVGVIPGVMATFNVLDLSEFSGWIIFCQSCAIIGATFVILAPPCQEVLKNVKQYKRKKNAYADIVLDNQEPSNANGLDHEIKMKDIDHEAHM